MIHRKGQVVGTPPSQNPPEQWSEAESYVQLGLARANPVAAVVNLLPKIPAEVVPSALGRWGGGHGVLAAPPAIWPRRPTVPSRSTDVRNAV